MIIVPFSVPLEGVDDIVPFPVPLEGVNDSCTLFSPLGGGELKYYPFQSPWRM